MLCPRIFRYLVLALGSFVSTVALAQYPVDELGPLPATLSLERLQRIALLSPASNLQTARLSQEVRWRQSTMKDSAAILKRQAIWPVRVETDDACLHWGEITRMDGETLELVNRKTNQTVEIAYASIRGIGIAKAYPRLKPPSEAEKVLKRTGDVIGTVLLVPVRILELFLVPQC